MEDTISRQAAIDAIERNAYRHTFIDQIIDIIKSVPSADVPERNVGKWTEKEVIHAEEAKNVIEEWQSCRCSVCGRYHTEPYMYYFNEPRFCSWCGAEMKGDDRL